MSITLALAALCLSTPDAAAQGYQSLRHGGNFGLGFGGDTYGGGLSGKYWITDGSAIQATVAGGGYVSNGDGNLRMSIIADYLVEMPLLGQGEGIEIGWSVGPGAGLELAANQDTALRLYGVAGLEFDLTVIPLDFVLEYRPVIRMEEDYFELRPINFGGHLRWYFS